MEPDITTFKTTAISIADLDQGQRNAYRWACNRYDKKQDKYDRYRYGRAAVNARINNTVINQYKYLFDDLTDPYDRLVALKRVLEPGTETIKNRINMDFNRIRVAPAQPKDIPHWIGE